MNTEIKMQLEFVTKGKVRSFTDSAIDDREETDEHKENLARELFAELRKAVSLKVSVNTLPDLGDALFAE